MGKIFNQKVKKKFEVLNLLTSGIITNKQASEELQLSLRQIYRLKERFILGGKTIESLEYRRIHQQFNKVPDSIREKIKILKSEGQHRSCQHISEILPSILNKEEKGWFKKFGKLHYHLSPQTISNILKEEGTYENQYEKETPAKRFEMENFGELVQMDSSPFSDICGYRRVYLILTLDDHSRKILSGGFFNSDNVYNNMLVLRRVIEKYGLFKMLYTDNASLFKYLRYKEWSYKVYRGEMRFYQNNPDKQITTEIEEALLQLGIPLLTHYPGHPRAKGKIERIFRFINDRFVKEYRFKVKRLCELNNLFFSWVDWYNKTWVNRDTGQVPEDRTKPSVFKELPKDINLDDIFCLKEVRKVDKTNSFSYNGKIYTLDHKNNLVGRIVKLHIHPEKKIRVWCNEKFIEELKW